MLIKYDYLMLAKHEYLGHRCREFSVLSAYFHVKYGSTHILHI